MYGACLGSLTADALVQAIKGTPTCYIFVCPPEDEISHPPFHALVPHGVSQEPGLILLSHSGHIRFWQSIGIGLAGGDNFSTFDLDLNEGDSVTNLLRIDVRALHPSDALYIHLVSSPSFLSHPRQKEVSTASTSRQPEENITLPLACSPVLKSLVASLPFYRRS